MKSKLFRFRVGHWISLFLCLTLFQAGAAQKTWAAEDDLPPPANNEGNGAPPAPEGPQRPIGENPPAVPLPSTADEDLPPPAASGNLGEPSLQVNKPVENQDDIFLPSPATTENAGYAPSGAPIVHNNSVYDMSYGRSSVYERPGFSMHVGGVFRDYATTLAPDTKFGYEAGVSYRLFNLGNVLYLHPFFSFSWVTLNTVGNIGGVRDTTYHVGGLAEAALGRRISLFLGVLRRKNHITTDSFRSMFLADGVRRDKTQLQNIGEDPFWLIGGGAQWDFWVVPHGSVGARVWVEENYASFNLVFSLEPAPRKKLSLNYQTAD